MYAGEEYQEVARAGVEQLDRLMAQRGGEGRFASLARTFRQAPVAEIALWDLGLPPPRPNSDGAHRPRQGRRACRQGAGWGKRGVVVVDHGCRRLNKKKK